MCIDTTHTDTENLQDRSKERVDSTTNINNEQENPTHHILNHFHLLSNTDGPDEIRNIWNDYIEPFIDFEH